ncbi:hypothetical protein K493DRAFT_303647 [Basidiobolus meristosporus CBS 931.73]|uniref:Uncharacterized protein n=1 Tax=Basidiobolus meristosporus CBS 931.73 TaxID=1314790 RepID=A0A1Y1Y1Y6_9FUNG|nr:hypothetical protein K493DRAFT_303647 [Basidiobolus meristosporus CBS 931.73]|eukprot:ORX92022.1 hypothetical protein K493DRAFT_303647 [Basidiobolus meristosporus CBS 931.73]
MDYIHDVAQALTPNILVSNASDLYVFGGFVENVFDKFLVEYPSLKSLTDTVDLLDQFASGPGTIFNNEEEFNRTFYYSPQYKLASRILNLATTPQTLAFVPRNASLDKPILLETSLNPYIPGSSISHFDFRGFTSSSDFLMRFMEDRGVSLEEDIARGGNYVGGPIGPQLTSVLETLGYSINPSPKPLTELFSKVAIPSAGSRDGVYHAVHLLGAAFLVHVYLSF